MPESEIADSYSAISDSYIRLFGSTAAVDAPDLVFLERHLGRREGVVVDAGCGPGHLTAYLSDRGVTIRGLDVVPAFVDNARSNWPHLEFEVGSMRTLEVPDGTLGGILAWYALIHIEPTALGNVLTEFRRAVAKGGVLVVGFFEGPEVEPFDHKVATAFRWPVDAMSHVLATAGFTELERLSRPGHAGVRPHAALAARAE
ncbi:class I SAM-dependent methyltransferase [Gordonia sp. PKS22-38]|uniref:Class I SAM-dependent methyltransferase n=1 Tax=Gordonia prachuapensis TaxID=3115651 RepID=A0ABU7MNG2_9ACTN|nr:class I SAM-dependent methyltransferase [Gordonia sp. PKS22-38]